jgi:dienelactone hydrolase
MRLIDYLATRKDVDASRIGLTGISKGGIETYLAAAADTRVAAAVTYIGVQSFKWALDNGQWPARIATIQDAFDSSAATVGKSARSVDYVREFYARVVPGIDGQFDGPAMLPLISPLFDEIDDGRREAVTSAITCGSLSRLRPLADAAKAGDKLQLIIQENTPHRVNPESIDAGIAWFVRWLKP